MKRLEQIVNYINKNDIVADIGCDHGYLLKMAIEQNNISKCYAIDNKQGPLNNAKKNLQYFQNVEYILSDGLKNVNKEDINCAVIAGMGGILITKIINDSLDKFKKINKIIIAANRNMEKVREFLSTNKFKIVDESIVYEDEKYYEIIVVNNGEQCLSEKEIMFGPILLQKKDNIFINKWNEYYNKIKNIPSKKEEINLIKEVLYES